MGMILPKRFGKLKKKALTHSQRYKIRLFV